MAKASSGRGLNDLLLPEQTEDYLPLVLLRLALLVALLMYTLGLLGGIRDDMGSLMHLVNLPFSQSIPELADIFNHKKSPNRIEGG